MARYAISAEGAASMRALAKQLYTEANAILESSSVLEAKVSAVGNGLGIYESEILSIIQQGRITTSIHRKVTPVKAIQPTFCSNPNETLLVLSYIDHEAVG